MEISVLDGSAYFKGLLLLIRKDRRVTDPEVQMMKRVGKRLGFEEKFCETAIREILHNRFIDDTIPEFSSPELAKKFIHDGLSIAMADNEVHPTEALWLRKTALHHGLEEQWFLRAVEAAELRRGMPTSLEADGLSIRHQSAAAVTA